MKRAPVVEQLLAALIADPRAAGALIGAATEGRAAAAVYQALERDRRFGPPLRAAIADRRALASAPWLVQFLGPLKFRPAIPELLAVWRRRDEHVSYQAGHSILHIGDRKAIAVLAGDIRLTSDTATSVALKAVRALGARRAFDRLAPLVREGHANARPILSTVADERWDRDDARWKALALQLLREGRADLLDHARTVLRAALTKAELASLGGAARARRPTAAALAAARALVAGLAAKLPRGAWTPAPRRAARDLEALERLVGPLPAVVRAFHEQIAGIDIDAARPRDRFVVYPLRDVLAAARAWAKGHGVPGMPPALVPPFPFPVAPDGYTKAGFSGGPALGFDQPAGDDDPRLPGVRGRPRFSQLLRRAARR